MFLLAVLPCLLTGMIQGPEAGTTNRMQSQTDTMTIEYNPIGVFHSPLTRQSGAPRQGALEPTIKGSIEIFAPYVDALKELDRTEYMIVLYHMHISGNWHTPVRPPGSTHDFGLFATRSPNRPNPIGFAVIRLDRIEGSILHVSGIDAFDGTPVLDIKPWLPSVDCPGYGKPSSMEKEVGL